MADRIARYRANLQGEIDSSAMYRAMAELDAQPERAEIFRRLAAVEESHADFWRKQLADAGASAPAPHPSWRARLLTW
ncbi:MAG: ferritin family protein, partial [Burkholderiales bacterium]